MTAASLLRYNADKTEPGSCERRQPRNDRGLPGHPDEKNGKKKALLSIVLNRALPFFPLTGSG